MIKPVLCPICGSRLIDANENIATTAVVLGNAAEKVNDAHIQADLQLKCHKCKWVIGIKTAHDN